MAKASDASVFSLLPRCQGLRGSQKHPLTSVSTVAGTNDTLAINLRSRSGALPFSSNWSGTRTHEQVLTGGNLVVR